jgi:hypothetical protein
MAMRLLLVNVAPPRTFEWRGQIVSSAIFKEPVSDRRWVGTLGSLRGIGPWPPQMFLLHELKRPDVFPAGDIGLRTAVARARRRRQHARRQAACGPRDDLEPVSLLRGRVSLALVALAPKRSAGCAGERPEPTGRDEGAQRTDP